MRRGIILGGGAIFALGLLAGLAFWQGLPSSANLPSSNKMWQEIAWPFGRDAWPPGLAFRCAAPECSDEAEVYIRTKMGFCNCTLGVSDDEEVDRVTDLDLISEHFRPLEPGKPVHVAGLQGRSRSYVLEMPDGTARAAAGIALSRQCDAVVAVSYGKSAKASGIERAALDLLSSKAVRAWLDSVLGGASAR
jgi:hypothetical protein